MEEWSIQCAMTQTDQLPSTYDNYLYNVMQYYIGRARTAGDKALYRRACLFVLAAIQHVKTEDDKNAVGPKLQALAKICTDQLESLN
jgi:hypothetical protein